MFSSLSLKDLKGGGSLDSSHSPGFSSRYSASAIAHSFTSASGLAEPDLRERAIKEKHSLAPFSLIMFFLDSMRFLISLNCSSIVIELYGGMGILSTNIASKRWD